MQGLLHMLLALDWSRQTQRLRHWAALLAAGQIR
jgi:hypothetical protein